MALMSGAVCVCTHIHAHPACHQEGLLGGFNQLIVTGPNQTGHESRHFPSSYKTLSFQLERVFTLPGGAGKGGALSWLQTIPEARDLQGWDKAS